MTRKDFDKMDPWTLGATMDMDPEELGAIVETPSSILAKMNSVRSTIETLDRDIKANIAKLRPMFVTAWETFLSEWQTFYKDHSEGFGGWTSRLWGATAEQVDSYAEKVRGWREGYEKEAGLKATGPTSEREKGLPWKWIVPGVLIVGGIVAVGYAARGIRGVAESF